MKKVLILLLVVFMLTGCGNKSSSELVDIEQFKCQDDIQTVFDVLGEIEMGTNAFGSEHYKYENLNLYGYNGYTYFGVRNDKKTIQDIECYLTLTKKEFEDVLSQFSEKYGSYEVANYSGNTKTYRWKIEEKKSESVGFNDIHIQENDKNEYMIVFNDEMSSKTDEFYFESLKEKESDAETSRNEIADNIYVQLDISGDIPIVNLQYYGLDHALQCTVYQWVQNLIFYNYVHNSLADDFIIHNDIDGNVFEIQYSKVDKDMSEEEFNALFPKEWSKYLGQGICQIGDTKEEDVDKLIQGYVIEPIRKKYIEKEVSK